MILPGEVPNPPLSDKEIKRLKKGLAEKEDAIREEAKANPDLEAVMYLSEKEHWNYLLKYNKLPYINTRLPLASNGANIIMTNKFGGDGYYPIAGSYDAEGNLSAVHIVLYDPRGLDDED